MTTKDLSAAVPPSMAPCAAPGVGRSGEAPGRMRGLKSFVARQFQDMPDPCHALLDGPTPVHAGESVVDGPDVMQCVSAICAHEDRSRAVAVSSLLSRHGVAHELWRVSAGAHEGLVVTAGFTPNRLTLCAHHDTVVPGAGALDNAGSCAALVLAASQGASCVWFDFEERGFFATSRWFGDMSKSEHGVCAFLNCECLGLGDGVLVNPLAAPLAASPELREAEASMLDRVAEACSAGGVSCGESGQPMPMSDHTWLRRCGHAALCLCGGWFGRTESLSQGFSLMHTQRDVPGALDRQALEASAAALVRLARAVSPFADASP